MCSEPHADDTAQGDNLRVMTYNVHSCIGTDGRLSVTRIARVIARYDPDIVALQELDEARARTSRENQAQRIADFLAMDCHFYPVLNNDAGKYGIAILTRLPMRLVKTVILPGLSPAPGREPRGVLWVAVMLNGKAIQVLNTHFGLSGRERRRQAQALLGDELLASPLCREPVILCGDFNALPLSWVCRQIRNNLDDAQLKMAGHRPGGTYHSRFPFARIDHVYVDTSTHVRGIHIPKSGEVLRASDHRPLIVDLTLFP